MRKTILALTAAAALAGGITVATTGSASAASGGSNCVTVPESNRLHAGMSPGDVRRATGAQPWLKVGDTYQGQKVSLEAFNDCRSSSKAFAVMYRVDGNGGRHMMLGRFINL